MNHTSREKIWKDEKGVGIPYNRIDKLEKLKEKKSFKLAKQAKKINIALTNFKKEVEIACQQVYDLHRAGVSTSKKPKGNFTFYNFDRSIKVECSINERVVFDDLNINMCKENLHEFLQKNIDSKDAFIRDLVMNAFETKNKGLDTRKVMGLLAYRSKIKDELFQQAMDYLEKSITRPSSKAYFRVSIKNEGGEYKNIDLNFSSITID